MNWGKSIVLGFVIFMSFVGIMAYKMATAKVDLVRTNYYQTELDYQKQFEKIKNSANIKAEEIMTYSPEKQTFTIVFPDKINEGEVHFYRSSDNKLDLNFKVNNTSTFSYNTQKLAKGSWKVTAAWSKGAKEFFIENKFITE